MTIKKGESLPEAEFIRLGENGPETVSLGSLIEGKRVALFAVPGAYTPTCSVSHLPSFVRTKDEFAAKGIKTVLCLSVNDPFVLDAWARSVGAHEAGIQMLSDANGAFTREIGMDFDAPGAGLHGRSRRYAMLVDDGVVVALNMEEKPGVCELTSGEALLEEA